MKELSGLCAVIQTNTMILLGLRFSPVGTIPKISIKSSLKIYIKSRFLGYRNIYPWKKNMLASQEGSSMNALGKCECDCLSSTAIDREGGSIFF